MLYYERKEKRATWEGLPECGHGVAKYKGSALASQCPECKKVKDAAMYASVQAYGTHDRWVELVPVVRTVRRGHRQAKSIKTVVVREKNQECKHRSIPRGLIAVAETVAGWIDDDPSDPSLIADSAAAELRDAIERICRKNGAS